MRKANKVIITCAVTGSIHTPSMSRYLPITPNEIAEQSIGAAEAGASIIHLHARNPETGQPTPSAAVFMQFLPRIKQNCDAVINISTGAGLGMSMEQRLEAAITAKPEVASLNMGSLNFNISAAAEKIKDFKHPWEKKYLESTKDFILSNTFAQIERIMLDLGDGCGTKFEFECYDVGHLYNLAHFVDRGLVKPPFLIQCIFGILGGIGPHLENLAHMRLIADKLFGEDYYLSVLAAGRHQMSFITQSALLGGNVRVGLEDSLYLGKGQMAKSNAEQVTKIKRILEDLSLDVATPTEARAMLDLNGADKVAF
jgi:uncharacterized protein (DUF849 family)